MVGGGVAHVAPGAAVGLDKVKEIVAIGVEGLQSTTQEVAAGGVPLVPPLQTPVPPPGPVETVIYVERADGGIDRLSFGWTPEKDLFLRDGGWVTYK